MRRLLYIAEDMADTGMSTRGRKRVLTDSVRKRNRQNIQASYNKARVNIGVQFERWKGLKDTLKLESHADVAKVLLDKYELYRKDCFGSPKGSTVEPMSPAGAPITSTPGPSSFPYKCDVSRITSSEAEITDKSDVYMSGIEEMKKSCRCPIVKESNSFINPFDLTIDVTEVEMTDDDVEDDDYEPSFNITLREGLDTTAATYDDEDDECISDEEIETTEVDFSQSPGCHRIKTNEEIQGFMNDQPFLIYYNQLLNLATANIQKTCSHKGCGLGVEIKKEVVASALYLKWICPDGHTLYRWCSQPILNRGVHIGDLMLTASTVLSGSNFQKISMFAKFLHLPILSKSTFYKMQRQYVVPSVDEHWINHQNAVLEEFRGVDLVVLGDGRMDSPGHSAQYCSYTFMEYTTKKILCIITLDKRFTEKKSTNLEKACFIKGLGFLIEKGMKIIEVVTDAHVQISSLMKKNYPDIKHSFDVWHGTKNLGKKIIKAGQEKKNKGLLDWTKDVVNHYWYTAQTCTTKEDFVGMWIGVLHHVVNVHSWILPYSSSNKCEHGPLTSAREKGWLEKDSPAHVSLRSIVLDKRLLNNIPYYLNCRSTAELENFQNLILMYASKRHSYTPPAYRCRNLLAALDHNGHIDREVMTNKDGSIRYQRVFQKKSSRWSVTTCKEPKQYSYVPEMMRKIILKRLDDAIGMNQKMVLEQDDPRRVSSHLAPIPPPPTQQIVHEQRSRFRTSVDMDKTIDYWVE